MHIALTPTMHATASGVPPDLVVASIGALPVASSRFTMLGLFIWHAACSAVKPARECQSLSAPASMRSRTDSWQPPNDAASSGVHRSVSNAFGSARAVSRAATVAALFSSGACLQARRSAGCPFASFAVGCPPTRIKLVSSRADPAVASSQTVLGSS